MIVFLSISDMDHLEDVLTSAKYLSPFQKEKFVFLFNAFFDIKKVINFFGNSRQIPLFTIVSAGT